MTYKINEQSSLVPPADFTKQAGGRDIATQIYMKASEAPEAKLEEIFGYQLVNKTFNEAIQDPVVIKQLLTKYFPFSNPIVPTQGISHLKHLAIMERNIVESSFGKSRVCLPATTIYEPVCGLFGRKVSFYPSALEIINNTCLIVGKDVYSNSDIKKINENTSIRFYSLDYSVDFSKRLNQITIIKGLNPKDIYRLQVVGDIIGLAAKNAGNPGRLYLLDYKTMKLTSIYEFEKPAKVFSFNESYLSYISENGCLSILKRGINQKFEVKHDKKFISTGVHEKNIYSFSEDGDLYVSSLKEGKIETKLLEINGIKSDVLEARSDIIEDVLYIVQQKRDATSGKIFKQIIAYDLKKESFLFSSDSFYSNYAPLCVQGNYIFTTDCPPWEKEKEYIRVLDRRTGKAVPKASWRVGHFPYETLVSKLRPHRDGLYLIGRDNSIRNIRYT